MDQEDLRREPRRAYFEDEDDEDDDGEEVATPLANVAVKRKSYERRRESDGDQDSGYSSKTGTTSSSRRDVADLKLNTSRRPQPYAFVQRPDPPRRSSSRARPEVSIPPPSKQQPYYVHKRGECMVCDTYGQHIPESAQSGEENAVPPSPRVSKETQPQKFWREETADRPTSIRRQSSVRGTRPASMYVSGAPQFNYQPAQVANMMQYAAPPMSAAGWATPITPTLPYSPVFYTPSVITTTTHMADSFYFEQPPARETRPPQSRRRSSIYGEAVVLQSKVETRPKEPQRTTSTGEHGRSNSERTVRSNDQDRSMPPPPRPIVTLAHRPSIKKSATYNTPITTSTNRRSQVVEDDDTYTVPSPIRERRTEPPPTSYRGPTEARSDNRPPNRKSVSYTTLTRTTSISSSALLPSQPRRSTTTATPSDTRQVVDAEAYQASRRSLTYTDLTAEALRSLKSRNPSSRSETSSHRSHRTKSSSSAGGKSKRSNSEIKMTVNGINMTIPASSVDHNISISTCRDGDVSISLGGSERGGTVEREQRRIEKAPSASSRMSSRSVGERERAREGERDREREKALQEYEKLRRESTASRERSRLRRSYDIEYERDRERERERERENPWQD